MEDSYYENLLSRVDNTIAKSRGTTAVHLPTEQPSSPGQLEFVVHAHSILGPFMTGGEYLGLSRHLIMVQAVGGVLLALLLAILMSSMGSYLVGVVLCTVVLCFLTLASSAALVQMKGSRFPWVFPLSIILMIIATYDTVRLSTLDRLRASNAISMFLFSYFMAIGLELVARIMMFRFQRWPAWSYESPRPVIPATLGEDFTRL
uniref:Uncharacterized protein n=1 Tax=Fibrocapsa japonica TaxID=94617 RepID=A0A7S2V180_9STRA|mmetsp:Transcript_24222/g.35218  ORF Transcript_24222/g.35218 Transcript_24222/m.35218 type:complete len:204 (+) Transcript_24222:123-734(+)